MRNVPVGALAVTLGFALAGCGPSHPPVADRPARPVVADVVLEVPGMT